VNHLFRFRFPPFQGQPPIFFPNRLLVGNQYYFKSRSFPFAEMGRLKGRNKGPLLRRGDPLTFARDPGDSPSVDILTIYDKNGEKVGAIFEGRLLKRLLLALEKGEPIHAKVRDEKQRFMGVAIYEPMADMDKYIRYRLSKLDQRTYLLDPDEGEWTEEYISACSVGDPVEFRFDRDRKKLAVFCGDNRIGYLPDKGRADLKEAPPVDSFISEIQRTSTGSATGGAPEDKSAARAVPSGTRSRVAVTVFS
jgi:hypothetical protein